MPIDLDLCNSNLLETLGKLFIEVGSFKLWGHLKHMCEQSFKEVLSLFLGFPEKVENMLRLI